MVHLTALRLEDADTGDLTALAPYLPSMTSLQHLELDFALTSEAIAALAPSIATLSRLTHLGLGNTEGLSSHMLFTCVKGLRSLKTLNVEPNPTTLSFGCESTGRAPGAPRAEPRVLLQLFQ